MTRFETISEVWKAIDEGKTVYWANDSYALTVEDSMLDWRKQVGFGVPVSDRNGRCLRVTCLSNWFGSLLEESEVSSLYVKE